MSILSQDSVPLSPQSLLAVLFVAWTVLSLGIGWSVGVFSPPGIAGPARTDPREPVLPVLGIMLAALLAYVLVPNFYYAYAVRDRPPATTPAADPATAPATIPADETQITPPLPTTAPANLSPKQLVTLNAAAGVAGFLALLAGNRLVRPGGLTRLGFSFRQIAPAFGKGVLGLVFVLPLITWVGIAAERLWKALDLQHPMKHSFLEILDQTSDPALIILLVFSATLLAPLYEELLFRGHFQTFLTAAFTRTLSPRHDNPDRIPPAESLRPPDASLAPYDARTLARWAAVVVTSVAFGIVHPWWTVPQIFFLSLCLGFAYERTGNLWVPIFIHALFNTSSVIVSYFVR